MVVVALVVVDMVVVGLVVVDMVVPGVVVVDVVVAAVVEMEGDGSTVVVVLVGSSVNSARAGLADVEVELTCIGVTVVNVALAGLAVVVVVGISVFNVTVAGSADFVADVVLEGFVVVVEVVVEVVVVVEDT